MTTFPICTGIPRPARIFLAGMVLGWLTIAGAGAQLAKKTLNHVGLTRTWYEHVPASYDGSKRVPLVIALHGTYTDGAGFAPDTQWMPKADAAGFIVVFPTGGLVVGGGFSWDEFSYSGSAPDEAGFLLEMIQQIEKTYRIDPSRIYMSGFSAGAAMTTDFAGRHASLLAAIAPISGEWPTSFGVSASNIQPDKPMPVWMWRGDKENFKDGSLTLAQQDQAAVDFWIAHNQDNTTPTTTTTAPYTTQSYTGGSAEVRFTSIAGAEHAYQPGISAKIWDEFFSKNTRAVPPPVATIQVETRRAVRATHTPARVLINLDSDASSDLLIQYTVEGAALPGRDYKMLSGAANIASGSTSARVNIKPRAGDGDPAVKRLKLTLAPGTGYTLGTSASAKVKIAGSE